MVWYVMKKDSTSYQEFVMHTFSSAAFRLLKKGRIWIWLSCVTVQRILAPPSTASSTCSCTPTMACPQFPPCVPTCGGRDTLPRVSWWVPLCPHNCGGHLTFDRPLHSSLVSQTDCFVCHSSAYFSCVILPLNSNIVMTQMLKWGWYSGYVVIF